MYRCVDYDESNNGNVEGVNLIELSNITNVKLFTSYYGTPCGGVVIRRFLHNYYNRYRFKLITDESLWVKHRTASGDEIISICRYLGVQSLPRW